MRLTQGSPGPQRQTPEPTWQRAPCPALAVDASAVIIRLNDAARSLLGAVPGARLADAAPGWLTQAHQTVTRSSPSGSAPLAEVAQPAGGPVQGLIGDRAFEAHSTLQHSDDPSGEGGRGDVASVVWWLFDVTEHQRLARELEVERERTAFLAEASNELLSSPNPDRCMEVTARLAARHLADAALVIAPKTGRAHPVAYCGPDGRVEHRNLLMDPAEVPGLTEALQGFPPVPSRWIDPAAAPGWIARRDLGEPGAMVVTALPGHGAPAGALVLLRRCVRQGFSEGEEVFARLFAARAGAAMTAARLYAEQTAITDTLMRELLPPRARHLDGVELAARYRPSGAGGHVGGDFYDLHPTAGRDGESLVVLGDVCGKGLEAAVLTGKIRNTLQALLPMAGDHQRMLSALNEVLLNADTARFATLVLASVRRRGAQVRVRLTSAGHTPPLIVRADGRVEAADTRGSLIGVLDQVASTTATVLLEPGETCLLYTDGITEAKGGPLGDELFGERRLREELARCGRMPPEAMTERVHMLAAQWVGGGRHDDMAVIAITAPRRFHLSAVGGRGPGRFTS